MKRHATGDVWTDAKLLQAEELVAEARAFTAHRALLRDSQPPRRGVRVWLGSLLLAVAHRLLGTLPGSAGPVWNAKAHARGPLGSGDPSASERP